MSVSARWDEGRWQNVKSAEEIADGNRKNGNNLDKDAFLQLLVAQMKYQDPLEPTSNTEYISQLATFSSLEEMQNMRASADMQRAFSLVGKEVLMKVPSQTGMEQFESGKVDFVIIENGKAFLSINEQLFSIDDLDTVLDSTYYEAFTMAQEFNGLMASLPSIPHLVLGDQATLNTLVALYERMNDYQKSFLMTSQLNELSRYQEKMAELQKLADLQDANKKPAQEETE